MNNKIDHHFLSVYSVVYFLRASQVALLVKNPPANAGDARDMGSIPGSGRFPGERNGNPLQFQHSCLENPWTEEPGELQFMGSQRVGHN